MPAVFKKLKIAGLDHCVRKGVMLLLEKLEISLEMSGRNPRFTSSVRKTVIAEVHQRGNNRRSLGVQEEV